MINFFQKKLKYNHHRRSIKFINEYLVTMIIYSFPMNLGSLKCQVEGNFKEGFTLILNGKIYHNGTDRVFDNFKIMLHNIPSRFDTCVRSTTNSDFFVKNQEFVEISQNIGPSHGLDLVGTMYMSFEKQLIFQ